MTTLGGYVLVERLGCGGQAEVFRAQRRGARGFMRNAAIKIMHPELSSDADALGRFVGEAKLCALLHHRNIVPVLELGSHAGRYFMVMDYVEGLSLAALRDAMWAAGERFAVDEVVEILRAMLTGLAYAHDKSDPAGQALNIVHRDLSPHNVLLSRDGEIRITDFGVAKATLMTTRTATGLFAGKPSYMAPEQAGLGKVDARADLFSAALIAYELLRSSVLHADAPTFESVRTPLIPPIDRPDVPTSLGQAVTRALCADPQSRFANAHAFLNAIDGLEAAGAERIAALVRRKHTQPATRLAEDARGTRSATVTHERAASSEKRRFHAPTLLLCALLTVLPEPFKKPLTVPSVHAAETRDRHEERQETVAADRPPFTATGTLSVSTRTWAQVYVDGRSYGETPLLRLSLPVGHHQVRLVNPVAGVSRQFELDIGAGRHVTRVVDLDR